MFKVRKEHNDLECPIGHSFLYGEIKKCYQEMNLYQNILMN